MKALRDLAESFKREIAVYRLVLKDERTPGVAKWLLILAISYALTPFDLIPDSYYPGLENYSRRSNL